MCTLVFLYIKLLKVYCCSVLEKRYKVVYGVSGLVSAPHKVALKVYIFSGSCLPLHDHNQQQSNICRYFKLRQAYEEMNEAREKEQQEKEKRRREERDRDRSSRGGGGLGSDRRDRERMERDRERDGERERRDRERDRGDRAERVERAERTERTERTDRDKDRERDKDRHR